EKHRDNLLQKLDYMIGYVQTDECREVYIRRYFGEENAAPCGHCDNCVKPADVTYELPTAQDVEALKKLLTEGNKNLNQIKHGLKWKSRKIENALSWLLRENRVEEENEEYSWKG